MGWVMGIIPVSSPSLLREFLFETADRVSVASCTWSPAQYFDVIARDYKITSNLYIIPRDYVLLIE
jgi:hypothetical protein